MDRTGMRWTGRRGHCVCTANTFSFGPLITIFSNNLLPTSVRCGAIALSCVASRFRHRKIALARAASYLLEIWFDTSRNSAQFNRWVWRERSKARANDVDMRWSNLLLSLSLRKLGNWRCELCRCTKRHLSQHIRIPKCIRVSHAPCHCRPEQKMQHVSARSEAENGKRLLRNVFKIIPVFLRRMQRIVFDRIRPRHCLLSLANGTKSKDRPPMGERARSQQIERMETATKNGRKRNDVVPRTS